MKPLRTKIIIWLVITAIGVALAVTVIMLTDKRIIATTVEVQNLLAQAQASDSAIRSLIEAQRQSDQLEVDIATMQTAFVLKANPLPYLTDLETLAAKFDIVVNFSVSAGTGNVLSNGARIVPTTVTITGPWQNDIAFINSMMQHDIYFSTTSIEIDGGDTDVNDTVTVVLTGNTYWQ